MESKAPHWSHIGGFHTYWPWARYSICPYLRRASCACHLYMTFIFYKKIDWKFWSARDLINSHLDICAYITFVCAPVHNIFFQNSGAQEEGVRWSMWRLELGRSCLHDAFRVSSKNLVELDGIHVLKSDLIIWCKLTSASPTFICTIF